MTAILLKYNLNLRSEKVTELKLKQMIAEFNVNIFNTGGINFQNISIVKKKSLK